MKPYSLFILFPLVLSFLSISNGEEKTIIKLDEAALTNLKLEITLASTQTVKRSTQAAGTIKLNEKKIIEVTPRISGIVISDFRSLGDRVQKGDLLCQLQSAELSERISNYVGAKEDMKFTAASVDQEQKLKAKNLSSVEHLREKELNHKQAIAAHSKALQPLKLLNFDDEAIQSYLTNGNEINYTTLEITAPESGEVISKDVRRGAAVERDQSLYTIADLSELWVDFYVSLRDVEMTKAGDEVKVQSSVSDRESWAKIIYISPIADGRSRAVLVRAVLDNRNAYWRPGTPVNVKSSFRAQPDAVAVPNSAIVDFDGGKAVFVKDGDATFIPMKVETGASNERLTEIVSGLARGQEVVSKNAVLLKGHLKMTVSE